MFVNRSLGQNLYFDRQYDEAIRQLRHTLDLAPDSVLTGALLAQAYISNNAPDKALHEHHNMFRRAGRVEEAQEIEAVYDREGESGMLQWYIRRYLPGAVKARDEGRGGRAWTVALFYARLAMIDDAFAWLVEAVRNRSGFLLYTKVHPWFDSLRPDARFAAVLKKMGLE